jgi:hypothetical protein
MDAIWQTGHYMQACELAEIAYFIKWWLKYKKSLRRKDYLWTKI